MHTSAGVATHATQRHVRKEVRVLEHHAALRVGALAPCNPLLDTRAVVCPGATTGAAADETGSGRDICWAVVECTPACLVPSADF